MDEVYKHITWNLDILAKLDVHKTLFVSGCLLHVEDRHLQFIRRPISADSRTRVISTIENTLSKTSEFISLYDHLDSDYKQKFSQYLLELRTKLSRALEGLSTLGNFVRYKTDTDFQVKLDKAKCYVCALLNLINNMT